MLQTQCLKIPILQGKAAQLRTWIHTLSKRPNEVVEALESEDIADKAVFYGKEPSGEYLYLYFRSADLATATATFQASDLPIDMELKALLAECLDFTSAISLELLFSADQEKQDIFS